MAASRNSNRAWLRGAALLLAAVAIGWFIGSRATDDAADEAVTAGEATNRVYRDVTGRIVRQSIEDGVMTVDHDAIEGLMPGMVMDFPLAEPGELTRFSPGDAIVFDLAYIGGAFQAVRLRPADAAVETPYAADHDREPVDPLGRGDLVPDITLYDATGRQFQLREMAPRHKIITFFYVRCPLQDFCPTQSARLAALQKDTAQSASGVHLVSLTLDGENDSPAVLADYARRFGADPGRWTLAGGVDADAVREFADRAGARVMRDDGSPWIDHALIALRIDDDRIVDFVYGIEAIEALVRGM